MSDRPDKERRKELKREYKKHAAEEHDRLHRENPHLMRGLEPPKGKGCLLILLAILLK